MSFGARARAALDAYGPLCVGIDPHAGLLQQWGLSDDVEGLRRFSDTCVEAFAGQVGFVKPQSAFFERFGARGVEVLETTLRRLRHTGSLTILDVKRGDIDSTAAAYAQAYLDEDSPMSADAITVSPFLGTGSLTPFLVEAERNDAGVFVLALTSNPDGPQVQRARGASGSTIAEEVLDFARQANGAAAPMGAVGVVVGATIDPMIGDTPVDLDINGPLLVPGFGAQGGTVDDIRRIFGSSCDRVIASTSRAVLSAGPDVGALRDRLRRVGDELRHGL